MGFGAGERTVFPHLTLAARPSARARVESSCLLPYLRASKPSEMQVAADAVTLPSLQHDETARTDTFGRN